MDWTFDGIPVYFDQHAFDGAGAEALTEADVLECMREGRPIRRKSGRFEVVLPARDKVRMVRYDYVEEEYTGGYWYVVSVSQRGR